jgi:predicted MFS family arabinose efflux permease
VTNTQALNDQTHRGWALFVLAAVYMSNCMDRSIVAVLGEAIKTDLGLSNAQLGLLGGMAFALCYSLLGVPIARLAERFNRTVILTVCITLWSGMTMLCALAPGFLYLALCRMGVGIGEAGCSPVAHSLVSDYYEARRRATAIAIYSAGCSVGQILIAFTGGWVAQHYGWRVAFVLAGIPGLVLALLIRFTLREPVRGGMDAAPAGPSVPVPARSSLWEVTQRMFRAPTIRHSIIGCVIVTVAAYGTHQFTAPFFIRVFSVSYAQAGVAFGVTVGVASALGLLVGGYLADRCARLDARWYAGIPALGVLLSGPLYMLGFSQSGWLSSMWLLVIPGVLHFTYLGPTVSVLHNYVKANERATASAILLLLTSLIGLGFGPWIVGWIIDILIAKSGSQPVGTRQGMVISSALYLWGAAHYAWAIRSFFNDLPGMRGTAARVAA